MVKKVNAVDLESTIARIKAADTEIKAWRAFLSINAANCPPVGEFDNNFQPLKNLTVGVKDIIDVAGLPTRMGSPIFDDAPPATADAACVALMRQAGAVIIGKTITTELASFVPSETRNPLNLAHTPGGSSSGSAAAVAAGHVDIAIGTQTAGSIIRPAAYCGVIGFKPSFGLVPTDGVLIQSSTLDTVGVFARNVEHCAAWLSAMTKKPIDLVAINRPLKLAIITNWDNLASPTMREAMQICKKRLIENGHQVRYLTLPALLAEMPKTQKMIQDVEAARAYHQYRTTHRTALSDALAVALDKGAAIDDATYQQALVDRDSAIKLAVQIGHQDDAWLLPAVPSEAPLGFATTGDPHFNRLASGLGLPAISLPVSRVGKGLPLGIQLIGRLHQDVALLSVVQQISLR